MDLKRMIDDKTKTVETLDTELMTVYRDAEIALRKAREAVRALDYRATEVSQAIIRRVDDEPLADDSHEPDAHMVATFARIAAHCSRCFDMVNHAESVLDKRRW